MINTYEKMVEESQGKRLTRARAIYLKCIDCSGYSFKEVKLCATVQCPLWRYRTGHEEKDELYHEAHKA